MIIKKVLTAGGVGFIDTDIVHRFTNKHMYYEIIDPGKLTLCT